MAVEDAPMVISHAVRAAFDRSAVTQDQLAAGLGIDQSRVSRLLAGKGRWFADQVLVVEQVLGLDAGTIIRDARRLDLAAAGDHALAAGDGRDPTTTRMGSRANRPRPAVGLDD